MRITSASLLPTDAPVAETPAVTPTLGRGARGPAVAAAQQRLLDAGYSLTKYGADGSFGRETAAAVERFQKAEALPVTGRLDAATELALRGAASPRPDYDALFADGVLRGALAIGYDETGANEPEQAKTYAGLAARGYRHVTDADRARLSLSPEGRYVTTRIEREGKAVDVVLELINPDQEDAQARFSRAMRSDELVLYGGHGRYGSGPDFDPIDSPAGNFVIGEAFEPGHVTVGANALDEAPLAAGYQLLFFDGCNTERYFDDLRARTTKTAQTLDVLGSTTELFWHVTAKNLLTVLDGVTSNATLKQLETALDENNRRSVDDGERFFRGDGFDDNPR